MKFLQVRRNQIASFLGLTLIILTISVAGAGYFTYENLGQIVSKLETGNKPNNNLILYKEIMVALTGMENQVEFYQLMEEKKYLDNYNYYINQVGKHLDSINQINQNDPDLLAFNDSLAILIDRKTEVLNKLLKLSPEPASDDLTDLEKKLERIPDLVGREINQNSSSQKTKNQPEQEKNLVETSPEQNETTKEKKGWLKRLFSSKEDQPEPDEPKLQESKNPQVTSITGQENKQIQDSLLAARVNKYRDELSSEIKKIKSISQNAQKELKNKEMALETSHYNIQNQIMSLISFLESRETLKLELNTLKAKELTSETNSRILVFTILGTLLLLTSLVVLLSYFNKNVEYQELLQESKKATENLARAKEKFFANMSHEIRTPMNAISGFTKILLKSDLTQVQREQVEIIYKSSDHLLRLLNDILDFSKLQAEKLRLENNPFNLEEVCHDVLKLLKENAREKGLQLNYQFANLPDYVIGDQYRLRQILLNLLNNSIKFTEEGEVSLSVQAKKLKEDKAQVQITVDDTGIGIPKSQQNKLFREFQQANQSSFSKGTGLGLAITKKLVLLHENGKIDLKSEEGKGTNITLSMDYIITDKSPRDLPSEERDYEISGMKALIADDEPFNIKLLATLLERNEISYDEAFDGKEAFDLLNKNEYDIVLLDLKMPNMDGWEIVRAIRESNTSNKNKLFIALTATVSKINLERENMAGFDHILRKPFDENVLFELIGKKIKESGNKFQPKSPVDLSSLFKMGDKDFVVDMVDTFITSANEGIQQIEDDLEDQNFSRMAITAHRIVAPARHFKAKKLIGLLKDLEKRAEANDQSISPQYISRVKKELNIIFQALKEAIGKEYAK